MGERLQSVPELPSAEVLCECASVKSPARAPLATHTHTQRIGVNEKL